MKIRLFLVLIAVIVFQVLEAAEAPAEVPTEEKRVKTRDETLMDAANNVADTPRNLDDMKILKVSGRLHKRSPKRGRSHERYGDRYADRYSGRNDDRYPDAYGDLYRGLAGTNRYGYRTHGSYYHGGRSRGGGHSRGRGGRSRGRGGRSRGRGGRSRGRGGRSRERYGDRSRERYDWTSDNGYFSRTGYGYGDGGHVIAAGTSNCDCPFNVDDLSQEQYGNNDDNDDGYEYQRQWYRAFRSHPCCRQRWSVYWLNHHRN